MKLVSIIVPVYNSESYLARCVDSLLAQTYQHIEVILVDDGSKDESGNICDAYMRQDDRVRAIHKENGGVSSARNMGIKEAKGEMLQFVDSDDYLDQTYTYRLVKEMEDADAELVIAGFTLLEQDYKELKKLENTQINSITEWSKVFGMLYKNYFFNAPWNKLFLADRIQEDFPENMSLGEDCLFVLAYLRRITRITLVDATGYHYWLAAEHALTRQYHENEFEIAKYLYNQVKQYSMDIFHEFCGENEVKYIFLQDLRRYLFQIHKKADWTAKRKRELLGVVALDATVKESISALSICSANQQCLFKLLVNRHIVMLMFLMKILWRN